MVDSSEQVERRVSEIIADLRAAGLNEAAQRLSAIQGTAWTTGSEWHGELARATREILASPGCPRQLSARLKRLLAPGFPERVVQRQLWQGLRVGAILLLLTGAVAALASPASLERFALAWTAGAVALLALLWVSTRRSSVCPGCRTRIRQLSPAWCPYCATDLATGITGPRVAVLPATPPTMLRRCPSCGHPPGGRGRYGAHHPSEGHFCSACGARLPGE